MLLSDTLATAYRAISTHRMRSLLTMLGIIIGVGSVVLMVSVGRSFERYVLDQIEAFSSNLIEIYPTGFEKFGRTLDSLTYSDYEAVSRLSTVESVAPAIFVTEKVQYGTEEISPFIFGTSSNFFHNYGQKLASGRLLTEADEKSARSVAVLAHQTAIDLFGQRDPIGESIRVGSRSYTVVGVLESLGSALMQDMDTPVYIPFTTARAATGQKELSYMSMKSKGDIDLTIADINSLLRQRHGIVNPDGDPDKDDFRARSAEQAAEIVGQVTLGLTVFIGLIAGVSLVVGGIGIMNIMLVTVTERTREIGLRKALGAKKKIIITQFLTEAIILTFIGGAVGVILGIFASYLYSRLTSSVFAVSFGSILLASVVSVCIGVLFGWYPANKASNLQPIEALRYE